MHCWVFLAARRLSPGAVGREGLPSRCSGFLIAVGSLAAEQGSRACRVYSTGSVVVVAHGLPCF